MKKYFILAAAALAFAACTNEDAIVVEQAAEQQVGEGIPVAFDSYVNRATTRAGLTGEIKDDAATLRTSGFGVFAYYTNADNYDQTFTPNFMYNQHVTYSSSWVYTPVKYWPNEFGNNALSDDVDKVSFFAYAPYVTVNPTSGKVKVPVPGTYPQDDGGLEMGIVGMKNNTATGDPMVKYISTFYTDKQVDLIWGTQQGDWPIKQTSANQTGFTAGKPWLDVQHPQATGGNQRVVFNFKHALASLNVTVDTKTNSVNPAAPTNPTRVYIRSVTFEGFDTKGALNLNNNEANKALWYNFDCCGTELNNGAEITIKDGRKDGKEGLTPATKEYAAINPTFVQDAVWGSARPGVTNEAQNLFAKLFGGSISSPDAPSDPIYVIPNGDKLKVTIEYDVMTPDANLAGTLNDGVSKGSVVKNVITRWITKSPALAGSTIVPGDDDAIKLENGKKYTINLHLGLNSVEFTAAVTGWDTGDTGGADLPHNN